MSEENRKIILGKRGTNKTVYKGVWNEKTVAIKRMLLFDTIYDQRMVNALKKLDHPNIVKLFHDQSDENFRNYYLELCSASLDQVFLNDEHPKKYNGPMPSHENVLSQLAKGLEHIHKMGFIHRDIKPQNVLIWVNPENGQVLMKWADFGLSKPVNERGSFSMSGLKGTDQWLAPELLELLDNGDFQDESEEQQRGTIQTDVFAEGLVFGYFLMGGVHLYGSLSDFYIPMNILTNQPVNLDETKLGFASEIIMKMLEVNPENRITSSQVAEQLMKHEEDMQTQITQITEEEQPISQVFEITVNKQVILGEGGYGTVYEGVWNNEKVAVKRVKKRASTTREEEEEEKALKKLDHPNVIKLLRVESNKKYKYYALQFCQASLEKLFLGDKDAEKYNGPMPPTIDVLCQLADGLAYIHSMGSIHRDIKPANVLIWVNPENGQVSMKWADFGLSRQVNIRGSYEISVLKGTDGWEAPEILKLSEKPDSPNNIDKSAPQRGTVKSDVYAEGLVFGKFLLKGRHIFGTYVYIKPNILENKQVNINDIRPEAIRKLIVDMLEPKPEERISSEQVADRIKTIKNQIPH